MGQQQEVYDVAIIGSGIAGSILGTILARHGQKVVIFEAKNHPRFAIGESMILETSESMRALAEIYDIPELAYFSSENYIDHIGTSHGVKRHFGFAHHEAGEMLDHNRVLQAIIPKEPHGHELHLYRQDTDYYLMTCAIHHGATVLQNTPVKQIDLKDSLHVIHTADGREIQAAYVVDAGGFRSLIADQLNLRHRDLQTHSRAIFTHMIDVPRFDDLPGVQTAEDLPFPMAEGTLHHVFKGGWLWVIPFNNHSRSTNPIISVGLMLDPREWPDRPDLTPEQEFYEVISQFPSIAAQFKSAKPIRQWARTPRLQYGSTQVVGDRWALLGHAAGFIDPLFSKGLYCSLSAVSLLAHLLLNARETGDYSAKAFAPLETVTQNYLATADRLIANSYASFEHPDMWQAMSVVWLLGAYTELVKLSSMRAMAQTPEDYYQELVTLKLAGGGYPEFESICERVFNLAEKVDYANQASIDLALEEIHEILKSVSWMPDAFLAILNGATHLPKNKLRLNLLDPNNGFMRSGAYRQHFFGDHTVLEMVRVFIREKLTYSTTAVRRQKNSRKKYRWSLVGSLQSILN
ncbi:MAG: NAD(P)/FAD-dependent oxidoreductase [Ardenticatenaceae bacterium]|nr:NAD(P)/FAD-dependent oxidoreductase [Ardenticatenaceae bacterium]